MFAVVFGRPVGVTSRSGAGAGSVGDGGVDVSGPDGVAPGGVDELVPLTGAVAEGDERTVASEPDSGPPLVSPGRCPADAGVLATCEISRTIVSLSRSTS